MKRLHESQTQAPEGAPLGNWAFAPLRKDLDVSEPNTEIEDELFQAFYDHICDLKKLTSKDAMLIQDFMKQGWYDSVLHEPKTKYVYRGMGINESTLKVFVGDDGYGFDEIGLVTGNFTYTPLEAVSSWTLSESVALRFADSESKSNHSKNPFAIMLRAQVRNNPKKFVVGEDGFYKVTKFDVFDYENEVIAIGKIKVNEISWSKR